MWDNKDTYKEWEDKGWAEMSELLEQQMPKEKRRRAAMLWWLLGLLLLLGLVYGSYRLGTMRAVGSPSAISAQEKTPTIIPTPQQKENNEPTKTAEALDLPHKATPRSSVDSSTMKTHLTEQQPIRHPATENIAIHQENLEENPQENIPSEQKETAPKTTVSPSDIEKSSLIAPLKREEQQVGSESSQKIMALDPLPISLPKLVIENEYPQIATIPVVQQISVPSNTQWSWGIEGGYVFSARDAMGGQSQLWTRYHWHKKWYAQLGLGYQYVSLRTHPEQLLSEDAQRAIYSPGSLANMEESIANTPALDMNRHYIQLPLTTGYQMNKHISWEVGVVGSYMFAPRGNTSTMVENATFDDNEFAYQLSPSWDVQARLGASFHLPQNWSLVLAYSQGIRQQYLSENNRATTQAIEGYFARNRWMSLSIRKQIMQ